VERREAVGRVQTGRAMASTCSRVTCMLCTSWPCFWTAEISSSSAPRASKPQSHLTTSSLALASSSMVADLLYVPGYHHWLAKLWRRAVPRLKAKDTGERGRQHRPHKGQHCGGTPEVETTAWAGPGAGLRSRAPCHRCAAGSGRWISDFSQAQGLRPWKSPVWRSQRENAAESVVNKGL